LSLVILFAAERYLIAMVAEEYRSGLRTTTDADSIGLPLGMLALLLGTMVIAGNTILAVFLIRRRRRSLTSASRPAE
jgi:hypothetical protein